MKKIIITLLSALILMTVSVGAVSAYTDVPEDTNEERILNILNNLEIMQGYEDGSFKPDAPITRAEFVTVIYNSVGVWEDIDASGNGGFDWKGFFFGDDAKGTELIYPETEENAGASTRRWSDVAEDYWAYPYMKKVADYGFVVGYPDGTFRPENVITYDEAVTVASILCGYKEYAVQNGAYPDGYNKVANHYNFNKGMYASGSMPLSRMDAATLIYNLFNVELAHYGIDGSEEKTFLNDIIGIHIVEGTLTDTDITSLYDETSLKPNHAKVNGVEFEFDKGNSSIRDYIGRSIRVYLVEDEADSSKYDLKLFEDLGKDKETVIDADLFEEFKNNTFVYLKEKDSRATNKVEVRNNATLIYNGKYVGSYNEETFKKINKGTITVLLKKDFNSDIIVVEDYKSGYIETVNNFDMELYDLIDTTGNSVIKLVDNYAETPIVYQLMNSDGDAITIDDITTGAINYFQNDNYIKVYFTDKKVKGHLRTVRDDEDIYYVMDGEEYRVSDNYLAFSNNSVRTGIDGTIVVDRHNEVVFVTDNISLDGYAYFMTARIDRENDTVLITYYDIAGGEVKESVPIAKNVKFYGEDGNRKSFNGDMIKDELEAKKGLIKLLFNDEGEIKRINLPVLETNETSTEIKKILETNTIPGDDFNKDNYGVRNSGFGGKVFLNEDTKVISIPADESVYQNFKSVAYNKVGGNKIVQCYSFDPESPYAKIVLMYQEKTAANYLSTENGSISIYYVTKLVESINDDGEDGIEATLFNGTDYITVFSARKGNDNKSLFEDAFNAVGTTVRNLTVQKGDFIMCGYDNVTGEIAAVRIIYDASEVNPAWCEPKPDGNITACTHGDDEHKTSFSGHFPGTTGFYFPAKWNSVANTNPIGYLHENASAYEMRLPGSSSQRHMFAQGFVYQTKEGLYEFTTQNLAENFTERDEVNYMWAFDNFTARNPKVFTIKDDGTVDTASLMNIKSYKQAGNQATRCLFYYVGGRVSQIWLLP